MNIEIINTNDGSNSIINHEYNETYHSTFGALTESKYVFIKNGLERINLEEINIFEIGFGTGLNAFLSAIYASEKRIKIKYTTVEKYPLEEPISNILNYSQILGSSEIFKALHSSKWDKNQEITPFFDLIKIKKDIVDFDFNQVENPDLVYFDAFSPTKQPEMWQQQIFEKIYKIMNLNGILVSYTAAGIVKNALRQSGFHVKRLQGPPGKHHMILATKLN